MSRHLTTYGMNNAFDTLLNILYFCAKTVISTLLRLFRLRCTMHAKTEHLHLSIHWPTGSRVIIFLNAFVWVLRKALYKAFLYICRKGPLHACRKGLRFVARIHLLARWKWRCPLLLRDHSHIVQVSQTIPCSCSASRLCGPSMFWRNFSIDLCRSGWASCRSA